jgi:hypothetical protein
VSDVPADVLRGVTQRVVDLYTKGGFLFTALDVSNAVKQTLASVRHREVSPLVRELFDKGWMGEDYEQTLIDVVAEGRKPAQAYLYHLSGADIAAGYGPDKRSQLAIPPVTASLDEDDELGAGQTAATLEVGADGRLRVPKQLLTLAGITGDRVVAEQVGDEIYVSAFLSFLAPSPRATVIEIAHPTLLHIPRTLAELFDPTKPVEAQVHRDQVRISGTLV